MQRGTTPSVERRVGRDAIWRPAKSGRAKPPLSPVQKELALARQALNRADDKACTNGITSEDLSALHNVVRLTQDVIVRWEDSQ